MFCLFLCSCRTPYTTISIEILEPSVKNIPTSCKDLLIYNMVKAIDSSFIFKFRTSDKKDYNLKPQELNSIDCVISLMDALGSSPRFETITSVSPENEINISEVAGWNELRKLCVEHKGQLVLCLESFEHQVNIKPVFETRSIYAEQEDVSPTTFNIKLVAQSKWLLLDPFSREIVDSTSISYYESYLFKEDVETSVYDFFHDSLDWFSDQAYLTGMEYAQRIAPKWLIVNRLYYHRGSKEMEKASALAKENKWAEAAEVWMKIYEEGDVEIAARAALNLALAYEMQSYIWKARMWALRSYRLKNTEEARVYVNKLFKRTQDMKKLDEQMFF